MLKKLLFIAMVLPLCAYAQEETNETTTMATGTADAPSFKNKRGVEVLPQAGDWSIGISASTALDYLGNIFTTGTNNNSDWWEYKGSPATQTVIQGKYFTSGTFAYRAGVNLNFANGKAYYQTNDDNGSSPDSYVQDTRTYSRAGVTLLVGAEKRKGTGRVQGVYGADVFFSFASNTKYTYEYGNAITETNQSPTFNAPQVGVGGTSPSEGYRITDTKGTSNFGVGAQAFIGVEVFVFPKISLGGMFTWGVSYTSTGTSYVTEEAWDGQSGSVKEYTTTTINGYDLNAGIGNMNGIVSANFYF
ncbi:hypothetical protein N7E81_04135 [Reichenbachiella carrageenanivorans]|uniref:Uncharacterized protein n=1 Tax=Reichenbachiella carrageenanivorans TaxID=2979869 RepID=A0ABY6D2E3_9BACT|nr:hypothetical protein [Reichenbachiella carrageenanivorans]UXX80288.1 hypothetical protein N7E81_04135 [Reichenbachiella carrageenanivorans]